ncbi:serine/threonine protein kinase [Antrihabitans sp. YC3-6]|uniref:Serine/threonine protein kinase n=1 Tax=Antrihabitans stalagmiti TaxID=2799499 RepID=A0A934NS53_9NOCA|nr:serine/threonine-protein kinase [Antrihabitans stalagmiti]MBJ8340205.1 serine/threonine protein kinase [Antrihabitans stalagmiti]
MVPGTGIHTARSTEPTAASDAAEPVGGQSRTVLADVVERFAAAWNGLTASDTPPDLISYIPQSPAIRRVTMIELVKIDLEHRWLGADRHGKRHKRLAEYCDELPELRAMPLPPDLIYEEFIVRRRSGQSVDAAEYTEQFPEQADELSSILTTGDFEGTLIAHSGNPIALDEVDVGQRVSDFDLMTSLGRGAFAKVFLARQRSMQRLVAVKISEDHGTEPQTLAQLDHDYIVRVFDQRVLEGRKLRLLYMQYVPGGTLLDVLKKVRTTPVEQRSGRLLLDVIDAGLADKGEIRPSEPGVRTELAELSWPETVAWLGRRLADALDYAGRHGVLHRDVKPANVLLTAEGVPKLADFNISFSGNVSGSSPVAYFGGSLAYMSPEQLSVVQPDSGVSAADLDTRSDLYSLAVVLWELLTGVKPFDDSDVAQAGDRTTLEAMLRRRRDGRHPAPDDLPADCPTALRRVLLKALAPEPADRWSTGNEMAQQLDVCLDAHARDLVDPPPRSWRLRLRLWALPVMALAIAVPNALAIAYGYNHNATLIISKLDDDAQQRFTQLTLWTYSIAFLLGFIATNVFLYHLWFVSLGLRKGRSYDAAALASARADTLRLGHRNALACFCLWVIAGIGVPATLAVTGTEIATGTYIHFFATQIVCGAIAVAYPFFLVNFYAVRCLYPIFLPHGAISDDDATMLRLLDRRSTFYLAVAAAVPLIGVAGATFIPPDDLAEVIVPIRVLCVGSAIAFVGVYWVFRTLENDLRALERVASSSPLNGPANPSTDT